MYTLCLSVPEWTSRSGRCCFMKQQRRKWGYVMPFYLFLWTADLVAHIAANGVSQDEFEEVVCSPGRIDTSRTTGRPIAIGVTAERRLLVCVYEHADEYTILPVTAFEPDEE